MKNILLKTILLTSVLVLTAQIAFAQAGPGAPPATPIDGGLGLLLAAGGAYGLKKLRDKRK